MGRFVFKIKKTLVEVDIFDVRANSKKEALKILEKHPNWIGRQEYSKQLRQHSPFY